MSAIEGTSRSLLAHPPHNNTALHQSPPRAEWRELAASTGSPRASRVCGLSVQRHARRQLRVAPRGEPTSVAPLRAWRGRRRAHATPTRARSPASSDAFPIRYALSGDHCRQDDEKSTGAPCKDESKTKHADYVQSSSLPTACTMSLPCPAMLGRAPLRLALRRAADMTTSSAVSRC